MPGTQQRIEVRAVIGVAVADEHRIDISGREDLQQPRHDRIARIYQQPRARLFDQVADGQPASRTGDAHPVWEWSTQSTVRLSVRR